MKESPKLTEGQYRILFILIVLIISSFIIGVPYIIPEKYHSYYAFFVSIIFLVDVIALPSSKMGMVSEDEKRAYPFFIVLGLVLILLSSTLLYLNIEPNYWIWSFTFPSGFLTAGVIFNYLRNRKIIP